MSISKFYLHDATTGDTGTLPSSQVYTMSVIATRSGANTNRSADGTIGTSQVTCGLSTSHAKGDEFMRRFVSAPLAAQSFSGSVTYEGCFSQNYANAAPVGRVGVSIWRPSTGSKVSELTAYTVYGYHLGFSTSPEWIVPTDDQTISGSSNSGDILVFEVFANNNADTPPDYADQFYFDGTTESSTTSAASFINFTNPVLMEGEGAPVWVSRAGISMARHGVV